MSHMPPCILTICAKMNNFIAFCLLSWWMKPFWNGVCFYPIIYWWTFPLLYVGWVHLSYKGCQVYFVAFILLFAIITMMENLIKQCRPWSDDTLRCVWSGFALFAYDPFMGFPTKNGLKKSFYPKWIENQLDDQIQDNFSKKWLKCSIIYKN